MKKRVFALITCTATMALLAGCGSSSGASGGSSQMSDIVDKAVEDIQEVVTDPDEKVLIDRENPEIEVTAEEFQDFQNRQGFSFNIPDGAGNFYYVINTDSPEVGKMQFDLDGITWTATEYQIDYKPYINYYFPNDAKELRCDFITDPSMKVHGVDGEGYGYYEKISDEYEYYYYSVYWYLEKEGYAISLNCYADAPIDSMPVEVFP